MIEDEDIRFTLRYPKHIDENLEKLATHIGVTKSALIRKILYEYFEQRRPPNNKPA